MADAANNPNEKLAFSVVTAAGLIDVSPQFIRLEISRKKLVPSRCGRRLVIPRAELERYLADNREEA